jgi:hypothetical protein
MKMTKSFDKLNDVFNVEPVEIVPVEAKPELEKVSPSTNDVKTDYEYTRGNLYSLMQKSQEALNGALELAQETDSPRAYEVAGQLIKNTGEIAEKIMNLQKTLKEIEEDKPSGPTTVNNALFVGTTADLTKLLKQQLTNNSET